MAESRLLELEITAGTFGAVFSNEQRNQMNRHIEEMRRLISLQVDTEPQSDVQSNEFGAEIAFTAKTRDQHL